MKATATKTTCEHGLPRGCCRICVELKAREEYDALLRVTGMTVRELDADLTQPDLEAASSWR